MKRSIYYLITTILLQVGYAQNTSVAYEKKLKEATNEEEITKATLDLIHHRIENFNKNTNIEDLLKNLENIAHKNNDSLLYASYYYKKSLVFFKKSYYDSCIVYANKSKAIFKSNNELTKEAQVNNKIGAAYQILFKNKLAYKYLKEAEPLLSSRELINNQIAIANVYVQQNDLDKSINYYTKAYKSTIKFEQQDMLFNIYNGMAAAYDKNKDFNQTIEYLQKALKESIKNENIYFQTVCYHNLGYQFKKNKNFKEAIRYFRKGLINKDKIDNKLILGMIYRKYADVLLNLDDIKTSKLFINKADSIYKIVKNTGRIPRILIVKAKIAQKENNLDQAINFLNQSLLITTEHKNEISGFTQDNYFMLSEIYEANGDHTNALNTYKRYEAIKDSLTQKKKVKEIESLKLKFDIEQYEQELLIKEKAVAYLEIKEKNSNYRNLLLGLTTLGLLFFIYRQRKMNNSKRISLEQEKEIISLKKEQLVSKVAFKDNRITEYAIHINQRNEFLESCKSQIKAIQKFVLNKDAKDLLLHLQYYIKNHIDVKKDDIEFDKSLMEKESDFKFILEQKFPDLTDKEVLVCKYLLLNLSSKAIAEKMNINSKSVDNYRVSIRRKTKSPKGENLKRYLNSLK